MQCAAERAGGMVRSDSAAGRMVCCKQYEDLYEIVGYGVCAEWLNYGGLLGA